MASQRNAAAASSSSTAAEYRTIGPPPSVTSSSALQTLLLQGLLLQPAFLTTPAVHQDSSLNHRISDLQKELGTDLCDMYYYIESSENTVSYMDSFDPGSRSSNDWEVLINLRLRLLERYRIFFGVAGPQLSRNSKLSDSIAALNLPERLCTNVIDSFLQTLHAQGPTFLWWMQRFLDSAEATLVAVLGEAQPFYARWCVCLGNLRRFSAAMIQREIASNLRAPALPQLQELFTMWVHRAKMWYEAAERTNPNDGRIHHQLAVLELGSGLRKACQLTKALTCVEPTTEAGVHMADFCTRLLAAPPIRASNAPDAEARLLAIYAELYFAPNGRTDGAPRIFGTLSAERLSQTGNSAYIAYLSVVLLLDFGNPQSSALWRVYTRAPADAAAAEPMHTERSRFSARCFGQVLWQTPERWPDTLPFAHVMLVWLRSLHVFGVGVNYADKLGFSREVLARWLTGLVQYNGMPPDVLRTARWGDPFPPQAGKRPLEEDVLLRGSAWCRNYFPDDWFDRVTSNQAIDYDEDAITMHSNRVQRILWLGLVLAFNTDWIRYNEAAGLFQAGTVSY